MVDLKAEMKKRKKVVDEEIEKIFHDKGHPLWEAMAWYPEAGGKKLRPFLTMVSAGALGTDEKIGLPPGLAIELIHNFTLVHDDIMDDDDIRRGRRTLHQKKGLPTAINSGDALFALSFRLLSETEVPDNRIRSLLYEVSNAVLKVAEGQEEDMAFERTFEIGEKEFIGMIEKKTSYLFQAAARCGAIVAEADDLQIKKMGAYARKMGIAFQVQDDYLDLIGDQNELGKPVGSDIKAGKRTLMVIHALQHLDKKDKLELINILDSKNSQKDVQKAISLMKKAGSLEYCKKLAKRYAEEAKEELSFLDGSPQKEILLELVDFMIERHN